jgi:hypothetical protein
MPHRASDLVIIFEMSGACITHKGYEKCVQNLVRNPEEKEPLG